MRKILKNSYSGRWFLPVRICISLKDFKFFSAKAGAFYYLIRGYGFLSLSASSCVAVPSVGLRTGSAFQCASPVTIIHMFTVTCTLLTAGLYYPSNLHPLALSKRNRPEPAKSSAGSFRDSSSNFRIFYKVSTRASTTAISARVMIRPGSNFPAEVPVRMPACSKTDKAPRA